jgi:repressor LexA
MSRPANPDLKRQILAFIESRQQANDPAPALRDILEALGMSSTSHVKYYIDQFARDGLIEYLPGKARSVRLTAKGRAWLRPTQTGLRKPSAMYVNPIARLSAKKLTRVVSVPVLGTTVAGLTTMTYIGDFGKLDVQADMLPARAGSDDLFALEVRGDSMIEAGIFDGDYVVLRKTGEYNDGDMVVVWLDDSNETTLKYIQRETGGCWLVPANSTMQPIWVGNDREMRVEGKAVQVVHPTQ